MTVLAPKRPTETVRYVSDWAPQLGDDTISSFTLTVASGTVTVANSDQSGTQAVEFFLAGGTSGQTSTLSLTVVTDAGQTLQRDLSIAVSTTAINTFPSTTTKGTIVNMAFEEIGLAGYNLDATSDEQASALRRLDALMARWAGPGMNLDVGYNFPASVGSSTMNDASGIPDMGLDAAVVDLALSIAPGIGKTLSVETRIRYRQSFNALRATFAVIPEVSLPFSTLRGAGNKPRSTWWPFQGSAN